MPASSQTSLNERPPLDERTAYVPRARQERFIVPLLRKAIGAAIEDSAARTARERPGATRKPRVLDIGCGGQPFRGALEASGYSYVSLDTQAQPGIVTDYLAPIDGDPPDELFAEPRFDLVLCTEVLEHVGDWEGAFANMRRVLAPGGRLIITCPHVYPLHEEPFDFWRPTTHALRFFAERHGLMVAELVRLGTPWDVLGTFLGASAPGPATGGPLSILASAIVRPLRSLAFAVIHSGVPQKFVQLKGHMYLSNLAVLEAPKHGL